jgi:hypothetical protein
LTHLTRWYDNAEILKDFRQRRAFGHVRTAQSVPDKLVVIEEGALADLLVIDGNPIDDIDVGAKPDKSLKVTMKDGKLYKTTLPA